MKKQNQECCPKFDPKPWDEKTHKWKNKLFIMDTIPQLFHMPLPWMIGRMIHKQWKKAQDAGAAPDIKDFLWLAYDPSPWKSEHYIYVTKEVPNANNVRISGTFISKVFDGPFNKVPEWLKDMEKYLAKKKKKAKKYYFYFTTCPKCAKKYGHNYVVAFAQV
ncbi:hypothetical protein AYK26_05820 [Euryarchaeota archaeon SM23-78]|nr:MAG: hypothetical protein AYK26_05820 [Euryarchaeota archaeon SM23-78]MBW3001005.1 hypothetical protein [Candidatus Woesearchaeota archaeon]